MKAITFQKLRQIALVLGSALLLSACAGAPVPATAEEAIAALEAGDVTVPTSESEGDGLICRSEVRTGTNFKRRTCRTAEEWEARARAQRGVVEERANNERVQGGVDNAQTVNGTNAVGF
jgi:hypothetical protein